MAQTARSFAALEAFLANNAARGISPTDLRDFLESALGCYGLLQITAGSTAEGLTGVAAIIDTWQLAPAALNRNTTPNLPANELRVDSDGIWRAEFSASMLVTGATDRFLFQLRVDDALVADAERDITGQVGERVGVHLAEPLDLVAGARLSVYAAAVGAVGDVTIERANLNVHRVG